MLNSFMERVSAHIVHPLRLCWNVSAAFLFVPMMGKNAPDIHNHITWHFVPDVQVFIANWLGLNFQLEVFW